MKPRAGVGRVGACPGPGNDDHPSCGVFRMRAVIGSHCSWAMVRRLMRLGKYWCSRPLVLSFVPCCQRSFGSQKSTCTPVSTVPAWASRPRRRGSRSTTAGAPCASCWIFAVLAAQHGRGEHAFHAGAPEHGARSPAVDGPPVRVVGCGHRHSRRRVLRPSRAGHHPRRSGLDGPRPPPHGRKANIAIRIDLGSTSDFPDGTRNRLLR